MALSELGVNFPLIEGAGRASTPTAQAVLAAAARGVDDDFGAAVIGARDWRRDYPRYFGDLLLAEAASTDAALTVARQGLAAAMERFVVVTEDGDLPLAGARAAAGIEPLRTVELLGHDERVRELLVPYRGERLRGVALLRQLDDWVHRGIVEPTLADAVGAVVRHPEWLDLRDRTIAMIGAGSEMGPYLQLMAWGATVAAVDLPRPQVWQRLLDRAAASAGRVLVPVPRSSSAATGVDAAGVAGADLLTQCVPMSDWLAQVPGPLTIGNYGYLDGAGFVRLTVAFGALLAELARRRTDLSVNYLATPSDVYRAQYGAVDMARRRHEQPSALVAAGKAVHAATGGRWFKPNYPPGSVIETDTERFGFVNAFILAQGPNYAFAKRLQRWQMMVARADGLVTSVHVAPPTRTRSVHSNPLMAERQRLTAYLGIETFDTATTEAIAGAMLVHDLRNPASPANPATPLGHPHEAFMFAANPGGRWRVPFDINSSVPLLTELNHARVRAAGVVGAIAEAPGMGVPRWALGQLGQLRSRVPLGRVLPGRHS